MMTATDMPGVQPAPAPPAKRWIARLRIHGWALSGLLICQLGQVTASLLPPGLSADIIDQGIATGSTDTILTYGWLMAAASLAQLDAADRRRCAGDDGRAVFAACDHRDSALLTWLLTRVSGPQFAAQWRETGHLNATVEESFTGQTLIRQIGQPASQLVSMAAQVQSALASAELLDALEMPSDGAVGTPLAGSLRGHVSFDHVRFRYHPDQALFEDVSFDARPGQMIAIVGPTGAGKTTLVNLLMRFYEIDDGAIRLDGIDIRQLSRFDLRRRIAMVLQDTWLFTGTIHDNIAFGRPDSSRKAVVAAAQRCHVDDFVLIQTAMSGLRGSSEPHAPPHPAALVAKDAT